MCLAMPRAENAQTPATETISENADAKSGDLAHVIYLVGLPGARRRTSGELRLGPEALEFNSGKIHAAIPPKPNHRRQHW